MTVVQFVEETALLVPMSALTTLRTGSDGVRINRTLFTWLPRKYTVCFIFSLE